MNKTARLRTQFFLAFLLLFFGSAPVRATEEEIPYQAFFDSLLRPRGPQEYGFFYGQRMMVLKPRFFWFNTELIRAKDPAQYLAKYSDDELQQMVASQITVISEDQRMWQDILMEVTDPSAFTGVVQGTQPRGYRRAAVLPMLDPVSQMPIVYFDVKPTGISVEAVHDFEVQRNVILWVRHEAELEEPLRRHYFGVLEKYLKDYENPATRETWTKVVADAEKAFKEARSDDERRRHHHSLIIARGNAREAELLEAVIRAIVRGKSKDDVDDWFKTLVEHWRTMDYRNGMQPAEVVLQEIITSEVQHELFQQYNAEHGTDYGTIRSYFGAVLPLKIKGPKGTWKWAGVQGRVHSFRAMDRGARDRHDQLPPSILAPVMAGANQFTIFGETVDHEIPALTDPRVAQRLGWSDLEGRVLLKETSAAIEAFMQGDEKAPRLLVESLLAQARKGQLASPPPTFVNRDRTQNDHLREALARISAPAHTLDSLFAGNVLTGYAARYPDDMDGIAVLLSRLAWSRPQWAAAYLHHFLQDLFSQLEKIGQTVGPKTKEELERVDRLNQEIGILVMQAGGALYHFPHFEYVHPISRLLYEKEPQQFKALVRFMGPELLREQMTVLGQPPPPNFHPKNPGYENIAFHLELLTEILLLHSLDPARSQFENFTVDFGGEKTRLGELYRSLREHLPWVAGLVFHVAQQMAGVEIPDALIKELDPENVTRFKEFLAQRRAWTNDLLNPHTADDCAQKLVGRLREQGFLSHNALPSKDPGQ